MYKILTILVPTYNMEKYLRKSLCSLILSGNNMDLFEVLIVNDGSKDSSSMIAHQFEEKFPDTFRVIDKDNGNYGSCINRGLKEAKGKYVKVLDADDSFDNKVFAGFMAFLEDQDVDMIISDYCYVNDAGEIIQTFSFPLPKDRYFTFSDMTKGVIGSLFHHGITFKTALLREMDYEQTEGMSYTDDEWVTMPMINVHTISYYPYNMYLYLRGRQGQTYDPKVLEKEYKSKIAISKKLTNFLSNELDSCLDDNRYYVLTKYILRLQSIYKYYLLLFPSKESNQAIADFDIFFKNDYNHLYCITKDEMSKVGFGYVKRWRDLNYNYNNLLLILMRFLFANAKRIQGLLKANK